jgi:hypothetical protein
MAMDLREQISEMLGNGLPAGAVAAAVGCDDSYVSQLLADEDFAAGVSAKKLSRLQAYSTRDNKYDQIEDKLLERLDQTLPMLMRPAEITAVLAKINAAKRRGTVGVEGVVSQQQLVTLHMPVKLVQKFSTNIQQQVIDVGGQSLVTISPQSLLKTVGGTTDGNQQLLTEEVRSSS